MNSNADQRRDALNEYQERHLRVTCEHIDKSLGDVEAVLKQSVSKAVFPKYHSPIPPAQALIIEGYIARIRAQLVRVLEGQGIPRKKPSIAAAHAIQVDLSFLQVAVEELAPKYMRGYGEVPQSIAVELNGIVGELMGLFSSLDACIGGGSGEDLKRRLQRLEKTTNEMELLARIEQVVTQRSFVEFRSPIMNILDRAEDKSFEIATFGRVSSGKSSLLNSILETDVLPVGVTPITAVPTRLMYGEKESVAVSFADRPSQVFTIDQLPEFVTEQKNPGNHRRVSRIAVHLPAPRLRGGVSFMDTPGLGSLATRGAAETLAYLPKCDLGVVLIDAASTLTPDDLQTIMALNEATVPAMVLLSKADLLSAQDRDRVVEYVREHIAKQCNLDMTVHAVSSVPEHRAMLDQWFQHDIVPLYARAQELRSASLKRKIGALRDSLVGALRARLGRGTDDPAAQEQIREVERRLRVATGKIESLLNRAEKETDRMPSDVATPFERAAGELMAFWSAGHRSTEASTSSVVQHSISAAIQDRVRELQREIESLAHDLWAELDFAAKTLGVADRPTENELQSLIRELPIFELPLLEIRVGRPTAASMFGKKFARGSLFRQLNDQVGSKVTSALETYSGVLRKWFERTLKSLKAQFDTYADGYRARAERLFSSGALSTDEELQIRRDLELLDGDNTDAGMVQAVGTSIGEKRNSGQLK